MARSGSDDPSPPTHPGVWVKPGYLPEAVEVSGLMMPEELTADLADEASRVLALVRRTRRDGDSHESTDDPPPPAPALQPTFARVEIDNTLSDEDSIVAGFADFDAVETTAERTHVDRELVRSVRRERRERRKRAQQEATSRPSPPPSSPPPQDEPRFVQRRRPTTEPPLQGTVVLEESLSLILEPAEEAWHSLPAGDLELETRVHRAPRTLPSEVMGRSQTTRGSHPDVADIQLGEPVRIIDEIDPAPISRAVLRNQTANRAAARDRAPQRGIPTVLLLGMVVAAVLGLATGFGVFLLFGEQMSLTP